jgi:hypothetical protein
LLFYFFRDRKLKRIIKKPRKPWTIPIEKNHLEELKKKDKDSFEKELKMMESEYKSAMMWYKSYLNNLRANDKKQIIPKNVKGLIKKKTKSEKPEKAKTIDKRIKQSDNKITKILTRKKPEKKRKDSNKISDILQTSNKKVERKEKKSKINEDKIDLTKKKQEDEEKKKVKLIAKIKKDQSKQKSKI